MSNDQDPFYVAQQCLDMLAEHGALTLPVDVAKVAELCGIKFIVDSVLCDGKYGMSFVLDDVRYAAISPIINTPLQLPLLRWCAAHEIGHHLLGHVSAPWSDELEKQADMFAAALLIPQCLIDNIAFSCTDIFRIARLFCVPLPAAHDWMCEFSEWNSEDYIVCS